MGSFSILNNISGLTAQNQLNMNNVNLSRTLLRLSSGKRVNTGADDAAGLQISSSLSANVMALDQAVRNANDGVGVAQIADGALSQMSTLLTRGVTLAEEAATSTVDDTGRKALNNEFSQIQLEIGRISSATNFNGQQIFNAASGFKGSLGVFVGDTSAASGASSISVTIGTVTADASSNVSSINGAAGTNLSAVDLTTQAGASAGLTTIKNALNAVSGMRANIGSGINRLQSAVAVLQTQSQNTQAAASNIVDANVAQEVANLTKYQILAQSGIAALAQANSAGSLALSLIKNA